MHGLLDDASLPTDIQGLEAQIAEVRQRQDHCLARIRELMDDEDPGRGVFHAAAIHEARQLKMMLQYQHDVRVAKRNRLRLEPE